MFLVGTHAVIVTVRPRSVSLRRQARQHLGSVAQGVDGLHVRNDSTRDAVCAVRQCMMRARVGCMCDAQCARS